MRAACLDWADRNPGENACADCGRVASVNGTGRCRLCWRRARALKRREEDPRRAEAVLGGHQLFIAGLEQVIALRTPAHLRGAVRGRRPPAWTEPSEPRPLPLIVATHRQPVLFESRARPVPA